MKEPRVAARYAKSLMLSAKENSSVEKVFADMDMLHHLIGESRDLSLLLKSPIIKEDKKLDAINAIFSNKVEALTLSFMQLVVRQNRASSFEEITEAFISLYKADKGIATVHITTAEKLSSDMMSKISDQIKVANHLSAVEIIEHVDPSIIGGVVLRMGDIQLDESVKAKINSIEREFLNA